MWSLNDAFIDAQGRYTGSLVYEEYTTEELSLNFVSALTEIQNLKQNTNV